MLLKHENPIIVDRLMIITIKPFEKWLLFRIDLFIYCA